MDVLSKDNLILQLLRDKNKQEINGYELINNALTAGMKEYKEFASQ